VGDTIFYNDTNSTPVTFRIYHDQLTVFGADTVVYQIDRQTAQTFSFHAPDEPVINLSKSDNPNDSALFSPAQTPIVPVYTEVVQRDSIVFFGGHRYHAYATINPSKIRVTKTSYTDEGLDVSEFFYDNIMHICVYEGKERLFGRNITKQTLTGHLADNFLATSILADIHFEHIDAVGFTFTLLVCVPDSINCVEVELTVSFDGVLSVLLDD
jgi:hypothetical protein